MRIITHYLISLALHAIGIGALAGLVSMRHFEPPGFAVARGGGGGGSGVGRRQCSGV